MSYKELTKELLKKLDITQSGLSRRCTKIKSIVPMSTIEATYIIAHQSGIKLDKYLNAEAVSRTRELLTQITAPHVANITKINPNVKKPQEHVIKFGNISKLSAPLLSSSKIEEAIEMSSIFPYIYLLENSIREFIDKIMISQYGNNWWEKQAPPNLRADVEDRMADDKKDSWHQRRGSRHIDYLDLKDLPRLVNRLEKIIVPNIIPSLEWFKSLIDEVYKSRCVVCHMNPLDKNNMGAVKIRFLYWQKQIEAKKELILKLVGKP